MTKYEVLTKKAESLVEKGRDSVPGIREMFFKEAEGIRSALDAMSVEEGAEIVPPCVGYKVCPSRLCRFCLSKGVTE